MDANSILALLRKNLTLVLLAIIAFILFRHYIVMISVMILFAALGMVTLRVSRLVPHISVETVTASAILIGYVWGWKPALIYGIVVGLIGYVKISLLKLTTIVNALFMGLSGVLADLFQNLGLTFYWAFVATFFIRANLGFLVFRNLNPDLTENIMHSYGDGLFNVLIVVQLMLMVYAIIVNFV